MADSDKKEVTDVTRGVPPPRKDLKINVSVWTIGTPIYRIHSARFSATQFNPGLGNARFSPMSNGVATLYGGINSGVVVMETLFHDLPLHSDGAPFDLGRAEGLVHSVIKPKVDLTLADLHPKTLRKMGVKRADLLDSTADQYPFTRDYSVAIHQAHPQVHGLQWSSRQHGGLALMLFGDRVGEAQLEVVTESERVLTSEALRDIIEEEADQLGVVLLEPGGGK